MNTKPKFVLLEGIRNRNRFFSTNAGDPTRSASGEIWYVIIEYAETVREAQRKLGFLEPTERGIDNP